MAIAAREARARGCQQVLSPVLDLARDPRWGRTEETYGEDPYLVTRLGVAAIRGYQGPGLPLAAGQGVRDRQALRGARPARGRHQHGARPPSASATCARSTCSPFEAAIKRGEAVRGDAVVQRDRRRALAPEHAGCSTTCCAASGASTASSTSDYFAIEQLKDRHRTAADAAEAARQSLLGGRRPRAARPATRSPRSSSRSKTGASPQAARRHARSRACCARSSWPASSRTRTWTSRRPTRSDEHARAPGAGAGGRAQGDRAAEERQGRPAPRPREGQHAGRDRPEREGRAPRRLQPRPRPRRGRARRHHARRRAPACACSTRRACASPRSTPASPTGGATR